MFTSTSFKRPIGSILLEYQTPDVSPFGGKRAKTESLFGRSCEPVPETLKRKLELLTLSYYNSRMRNFNILADKEEKLYGLMTNHEGNNICWIQPTRVKNITPDVEYDRYIKKINDLGTQHKSLDYIGVGVDCIAQYEVDSHWYRGLIVGEEPEGKWLVLFVDYGNSQICSYTQVKQPILEPECDHFHAPLQAICCRLYNIIPRLPSLQNKVDSYFDCFFARNAHKFLEIKVKDIRPDCVVECDVFMKNKDTKKGINRLYRQHIGQRLVDAGAAKFADPQAAHAVELPDPKAEVIELN